MSYDTIDALRQAISDTVNGIMANAQELMSKGEADYSRGLLDAKRRFERLLPDEPPKVEEAPAPLPPPPAPPPELVQIYKDDELPEGI